MGPSPKIMPSLNSNNCKGTRNSASTPPETPPGSRPSLEAQHPGRMTPQAAQTKILRLVEELRVTIDALDNDEEIRGQVPESTLSQVSRWMSGGINDDLESSPNPLNATA